jgi:hypothetical protein
MCTCRCRNGSTTFTVLDLREGGGGKGGRACDIHACCLGILIIMTKLTARAFLVNVPNLKRGIPHCTSGDIPPKLEIRSIMPNNK